MATEAGHLKQETEEGTTIENNVKKFERLHFGKSVKLNVGGVMFKTSLSTLRSDPNSMLAAMFSGRFELEAEDDGAYFIDRDGELFRYILNYLRNGELLCSEETLRSVEKQLLVEAEYYQLQGLVEELSNLPRVFTDSSVLTSRDMEDTLLSWLPKAQDDTKWVILFKATRDGWEPAFFHNKCDGKKPTLVLIKSRESVFGGYADRPWSSPASLAWTPCRGSFLFTLKNPLGIPPEKIYPKATPSADIVGGGINYSNSRGPSFGGRSMLDISTMESYSNPRMGSIELGNGFQSFKGHGDCFFTGCSRFLMDELEVFGLEVVS